MEKASSHSPRDTSNGLQMLVWAEHGSSGLWEFRGEPSERLHLMVHHERLPDQLSARFESWMTAFDLVQYEADSFDDEGRSLAQDLKRFFGERTRVVYRNLLGEDEELG